MSDFIYSQKPLAVKMVERAFHLVYGHKKELIIFEVNNCFLYITKNIYNGFEPLETANYICAVIGGPVLKFRDNKFITTKNSNEGTTALYNRWIGNNKMRWDEDLDGPFVVLLLDKHKGHLTLITDMMSFIPVFQYHNNETFLVGTHLNTLDYINQLKIDKTSIADLILNDVITFPYSVFLGVTQIYPASIHKWTGKQSNNYSFDIYWSPNESDKGEKQKASMYAERIRKGLKGYVDSILEANPRVAVLMSGGEDSRTVLGSIPLRYAKDGIMFTESLNNEVKITKKVAKKNNMKLKIVKVHRIHFPDTMESCSNLVGAGADCANVHAFGFQQVFESYDAIFGGFLADTLLKVLWDKKNQSNSRSKVSVSKEVFDQLNKRREVHRDILTKMRPNSYLEWQGFWPMSMQRDIPNIWGHRRLFKNYEPFTASEILKVSSAASQKIKKNRILFQKVALYFLRHMKWIPHNTGFLPYFSHKINTIFLIPYLVKAYRKLYQSNISRGNTWPNYEDVFKLSEMKEKEDQYLSSLITECNDIFPDLENLKVIENNKLSDRQKRNILQISYYIHLKQRLRAEVNSIT